MKMAASELFSGLFAGQRLMRSQGSGTEDRATLAFNIGGSPSCAASPATHACQPARRGRLSWVAPTAPSRGSARDQPPTSIDEAELLEPDRHRRNGDVEEPRQRLVESDAVEGIGVGDR